MLPRDKINNSTVIYNVGANNGMLVPTLQVAGCFSVNDAGTAVKA